ncbi:MAG: hypothetical protein HC850_14300 [Rhodomicrobium sp.]|nr:hypothetical protein [Rhodomicrobium sp.]
MMGTGIGEALGQILLLIWTGRLAMHFIRNGQAILGVIGLATVPLWIAGLSEPFGTVIASLPVIEAAPFAFMAFELWLAAIGLVWIAGALRSRQRAIA